MLWITLISEIRICIRLFHLDSRLCVSAAVLAERAVWSLQVFISALSYCLLNPAKTLRPPWVWALIVSLQYVWHMVLLFLFIIFTSAL